LRLPDIQKVVSESEVAVLRPRLLRALELAFSILKQHSSFFYAISIIFSSILVLFRRSLSSTVSIHSTAFLAQSTERLPRLRNFSLSDFSIAPNSYLYRAPGQPDLSLIVTVPESQKSSIVPIFNSNIAHDVLVCVGSCDPMVYFGILPRVLTSVVLNLSEKRKLECSIETPLDLIAVVSKICGPFESVERFGRSGYPEVRVFLPASRFQAIEAIVAALNRMEHRLVDGPMLFETDGDARFVGIPVLYTALFLAVFAGMAVQVGYLDFGLVVAVAFACEFKVLVGVPFAYALWTGSTAEGAMIPLLLRMLAEGLKNPASVPGSLVGIAGMTFLPPFATPLLYRQCGIDVLPIAFAACGVEMRNIWRRFMSNKKSE
jgi:hypothetical protein